MSVLVDGKPEEIPGLVTRSPIEDPSLLLTTQDRGARPSIRIRAVVVHTTEGTWPQTIRESAGKPGAALAYVRHAAKDHRCAAAHLWIDRDGVVFCSADLVRDQTWHAVEVNGVSIGVEYVEIGDGVLYRPQIDAGVVLVDWLTRRFRIQRQIPDRYRGALARLGKPGGRDVVGVYGHRDQASYKGHGDPGDAIMESFAAAGYERFNFAAHEDLDRWRSRQTVLGFRGSHVDGIALDRTCDALAATGKPHGLYVERPGDRL